MAVLPIALPYGIVAIYSVGLSNWGLFSETDNTNIIFGQVAQISSEGATLAIGDNVMYNKADSYAPDIVYVYNSFNLFPENKVIAIETPFEP